MRSSLLCRFSLLALLIVPACSAQAQDAASAKTFLQSIYARYQKNGRESRSPDLARADICIPR